MLLDAEPAAFRAGAERIVEREQPRLDLRNGEAGHRAGEFFREDEALGSLVALLVGLRARRRRGIGELGDRETIRELERLFERVRKPRRDVRPHHEAVDHDVDVVREFLVERRHLGDLVEGAVDLDALVALLHKLGELLAVLALAPAHHRREQVKPGAFRQRHDAVDHLRDGLALDRQPRGRRIGHADACPQKPHIVVDLGDGADGRARIARGGLLLDGDGGRQAVDLVDVRLLHHLQELPRVGRKAFHIAALALGIDGVESERGFARAGQAGEHHELVARDVEVDILEIVLARAADGDHAGVALLAAGGFIRLVEQVVHASSARPRNGGDPGLVMRIVPRQSGFPPTGNPIACAMENPCRNERKKETATAIGER